MQIEKIEFNDDRFPKLLRSIKSPPKQLYLLGNADLLNKKSIAIIGSRKCSEAGAKIAKKFSNELSSTRNMYNKWYGKRYRYYGTFGRDR